MHKVSCANCNWEGTDEDEDFMPLEECSDLQQRLDPGCEVPAGECCNCGSFCYLVGSDDE